MENIKPNSKSSQLFVVYGRKSQGQGLLTQKLSKWILCFIISCYDQAGGQVPDGLIAFCQRYGNISCIY